MTGTPLPVVGGGSGVEGAAEACAGAGAVSQSRELKERCVRRGLLTGSARALQFCYSYVLARVVC